MFSEGLFGILLKPLPAGLAVINQLQVVYTETGSSRTANTDLKHRWDRKTQTDSKLLDKYSG